MTSIRTRRLTWLSDFDAQAALCTMPAGGLNSLAEEPDVEYMASDRDLAAASTVGARPAPAPDTWT